MTEREKPPAPMPLLVRSLTVLSCIADHPHGLTLQQLHQMLNIPLGSIHRILSTLDGENYVTRLATSKRYVVGPAARSLARAGSYEDVLVPPPAELIELGRITGEAVFLTQLTDSRVICVALVESRHHLRLFVRLGLEMPLHAAASARVILAYRDPRLVEALLMSDSWETFTSETPSDVDETIERFARIREHGFDVCHSELDEGVWAVAAPVFDATGMVDYGVTMAAAIGRMKDPRTKAEVTSAVVRTATRLSAERGWTRSSPLPSVEELTARYEQAGDSDPISDRAQSLARDVIGAGGYEKNSARKD